ncbi:hypothetical protein WK04_06060 [Burkholderia ubonensis]|nr:hypothetical protein WK04_06060 [Burkholderia ubonensis]
MGGQAAVRVVGVSRNSVDPSIDVGQHDFDDPPEPVVSEHDCELDTTAFIGLRNLPETSA